MAAKTGTYTLISSNTLGSNTGTVTFSSVPGTYTDLVLVMNIIGNATQQVYWYVNSDSGTNYSGTYISGNGTSPTSSRFTNQTVAPIGIVPNTVVTNPNFNAIVNFQDYANTTTYKTVISRANNASNGTEATVSLWRSTAAITSISITSSTSSFAPGSTFKLYGIEAGNL